MGKGLWEALYWLREFIQYFEIDYNMAIEEYKDILYEDDKNLSEDDRFIKQEQKKFMNQMFKEQFPDIIEIILIYTQRNSK